MARWFMDVHGMRPTTTTSSMHGMVTARPTGTTAMELPRIGKALDGKNLDGPMMEKFQNLTSPRTTTTTLRPRSTSKEKVMVVDRR